MIDLMSKDGLRFLESVCFSKTLFAFDFDGTLCKIVRDPERAQIQESTLALLRELGKRAPVAIISGRGLDDLRNRISLPQGILVGNHGLEGIHSARQKLSNFREASQRWSSTLNREFAGKRGLEGVEIEDKAYSIAIHYRKSRSKKSAKSAVLEAVAKLRPSARIILGKSIVNVVPVGAPHKGVALLELMLKTRTRSAFYIGDDDTDEDVFALPEPNLFTIRVGKKSASRAKFYLERQGQMNSMLAFILKNLRS